MKTKNIITASFAFLVAIGSAFASFFAPEDVYVAAKLKSAPNGATVCVNTGVQCDATGDFNCMVVVPVTGGMQTACSGCTFKTYRGTLCIFILKATISSNGGTSTVNTIDHLVNLND